MVYGTIHRVLQLHLIGLISVDVQDDVLSTHETELRGLVLESGDRSTSPTL